MVGLYFTGTVILLTFSSYHTTNPNQSNDTVLEKLILLPKRIESMLIRKDVSDNEMITTTTTRNINNDHFDLSASMMYRYHHNDTISTLGTIFDDPEETDRENTTLNLMLTESNVTRVPDVAWIMSFGGSGTSYTIVNTEKMTNYSTASNYGQDYIPCISLDARQNGPYIRSIEKGLPEKYILTKTHCGGYCMDCAPSYYMHTLESFEVSCRTGTKRRSTGKVVTTTYENDLPKRVIHLIRNPFDNIIGRMHLSSKHKISRKNDTSANEKDEEEEKCSNDEVCLKEWCHYLDEKYAQEEKEDQHFQPLYRKYHHVPCHSEWFRYIQWHNFAYQVHTDVYSNIPVHYLYYDNYTTHFNETVQQLFHFLEFPMEQILQNDPYPFISSGKSYSKLFDMNHATAARDMIHDLAVPSVWKLIQHYFTQYYVEYNQTQAAKNITTESDEKVEGDDDDTMDNTQDADNSGTIPLDKMNDPSEYFKESGYSQAGDIKIVTGGTETARDSTDPQIVWLLSFPNSVSCIKGVFVRSLYLSPIVLNENNRVFPFLSNDVSRWYSPSLSDLSRVLPILCPIWNK
jgi:hypothetical protein